MMTLLSYTDELYNLQTLLIQEIDVKRVILIWPMGANLFMKHKLFY